MTTTLIKAIENGNFDDAFLLIKANQNDIVNMVDEHGTAPIHLTTDHSMYDGLTPHEITKLNELTIALVQAGANVTLSSEGMLPIHYLACQKQPSLEIFKSLLVSDDVLNLQDAAKCTPLHYLAERESWHIFDFIIQKDIDIQLPQNLEGKSAIDLLPKHGHEYKAKLLKLAFKTTNDLTLSSQSKVESVPFLPSKSQSWKIPECEVLEPKENVKSTTPENNTQNKQPSIRFKPY